MRRSSLVLLLLLCGSVYADTHTSNGTGGGVFSAAGTWAGGLGVPADADAFVIAAGDTVTFDMDQSLWAGMAASTINATGTLIASTAAAAYVLKMNADLTVNGTLKAGTSVAVPYPSTCTFTINFSASVNNIEIGATGKVYFYCTEPTNKWITLQNAEILGATVLEVNTDVTDDIWADGNTVHVDDVTNANADVQECIIDAGGIAEGAITITAGTTLNSDVTAGSTMTLVTRNIRVINSTGYAFRSSTSSSGHYIAAEVTCANGLYLVSSTTIGGVINSTGTGLGFCVQCIVNGPIVGGSIGVDGSNSCTINSLVSGATMLCINQGRSNTLSSTGQVSGGTKLVNNDFGSNFVGALKGSPAAFTTSGDIAINSTISTCTTVFEACGGIRGQFITSSTTTVFSNCINGALFNTLFEGTEFSDYNGTTRAANHYLESSDHDGTANAYKAWCRGGIVTSQTASPPTGYTIFYDHEVESALYPCFRQYAATVLPGTAIEVSAVIRNTDGIDVSSTSPIDLRPRLEIIDVFADPLVDSTQTALDSDAIADADGSDTSWQAVDVIWANTGDSPRQVYVRIICYSHDASTHTIDEAWSVADYQDQINAIYIKLPTDYIMGSSVLTAKDDEIDDIFVDTGTTIPALIAGITVDNGAIADEVVLHMDANSTDFNTLIGYAQEWDPNFTAILSDTNEVQTDWTNGGRLDLLIDAIKAITDVMQAVNSTVSDANDANNFIITNTGDINDVNDAYNGMTVYVRDATTNDWESRLIDTWETGREITVDTPFTFTPAAGDVMIIWGTSYFPMDVYNGLPLPPSGETIIVDRRVAPSGGTIGGSRTLDAESDDP